MWTLEELFAVGGRVMTSSLPADGVKIISAPLLPTLVGATLHFACKVYRTDSQAANNCNL